MSPEIMCPSLTSAAGSTCTGVDFGAACVHMLCKLLCCASPLTKGSAPPLLVSRAWSLRGGAALGPWGAALQSCEGGGDGDGDGGDGLRGSHDGDADGDGDGDGDGGGEDDGDGMRVTYDGIAMSPCDGDGDGDGPWAPVAYGFSSSRFATVLRSSSAMASRVGVEMFI